MKLGWGVNIALFYGFFVIALLIVVFIFMRQDVGLVSPDYYAREIAYQEQIDRTNRTNELAETLEITMEPSQIVFSFPKNFESKNLGGRIHFYRPSNKEKDFVAGITADSSGNQIIDTGKLEKGLWKIKVDWRVRDVSYFNEKILMVN